MTFVIPPRAALAGGRGIATPPYDKRENVFDRGFLNTVHNMTGRDEKDILRVDYRIILGL